MNSNGPNIKYINQSDWQLSFGFSQAVVVEEGMRRMLLAGVGSEGGDGNVDFPGKALEQCRSAWQNILAVLATEGATHRNIVRVRTYVTDAQYLSDVTAARLEVFGDGPYPIHTFLVVSRLAKPGMLIEIEAEAVLEP